MTFFLVPFWAYFTRTILPICQSWSPRIRYVVIKVVVSEQSWHRVQTGSQCLFEWWISLREVTYWVLIHYLKNNYFNVSGFRITLGHCTGQCLSCCSFCNLTLFYTSVLLALGLSERLIDWLIYDWIWDLIVLMHLGINWQAPCAPYQSMGALLLCWSSRWLPDLYSWCPLASRRRSPDTHVWMKPKLHIHKKCRLRFHPLLHISYTMECLRAPLGEDVLLGYYDQ
jgi:hypothetical protein